METQQADRVTRVHAKWLPAHTEHITSRFMPLIVCNASMEAAIKCGLIQAAMSTSSPTGMVTFRPLFGAN